MGEEHERGRSSGGGSSDHPLLADSRRRAAEDVQCARDDDHGRDPRADAGGLGYLLQPAGDLGAVEVRTHAARPAGIPVRLEVVSPDVCEYGHFDGQCPEAKGNTDGALAGCAVPEAIRGEADAGARNAGFAEGFGASIDYLLRHRELRDADLDRHSRPANGAHATLPYYPYVHP